MRTWPRRNLRLSSQKRYRVQNITHKLILQVEEVFEYDRDLAIGMGAGDWQPGNHWRDAIVDDLQLGDSLHVE